MKRLIFFTLTVMLFNAVFSQSDNDFLIASSFSQGSANNCASIALIKAAMLKYGYKNLFKVVRDSNSYQITLKDGTQFYISNREKTSAMQFANFKIPNLPSLGNEKDSVLFYSYLAYASIAKFISIKGYWGCEEDGSPHLSNYNNYDDALRFISRTSFCTDYCNRLLGYKIRKDSIYNFGSSTGSLERGTILYSPAHAVAAFNDHLDCHGSWVPINTNEVCSNYFKWYIVLE